MLTTSPGPTPAPEAGPATQTWRQQVPAPGPSLPVEYPSTVEIELDSGLKLYWVRRPAAVATLSFVVAAGAAQLDSSHKGLSALTARMLTEETQHFPGTQLAEAVEGLGSSLEYSAGRESTSFSLQVLKRDLAQGLGLLAEVVKHPKIRTTTLERVRREWIDSLNDDRQAPQTLATLAGFRAVLGPELGLPTRGTPKSIGRLKVGDLLRYHQRVFSPKASSLIVVGDVELAEVAALAADAFEPWQADPRAASAGFGTLQTERTTSSTRSLYVIDRPEAVQTAVFVGQPFPGREAGDYEAAQVMNNALGGLFSSRLNRNLREEHGYTYGAYSSIVTARSWGLFFAASSVRREVTVPALAEMWGELGNIERESGVLEPDELARAKSDLIRQLGTSLEDVSRIAKNVELQFVQELGVTYFERLPALYGEVDAAMAAAAAQRLDGSRWVTVLVGDRSALEPPLSSAGHALQEFPMAWLD